MEENYRNLYKRLEQENMVLLDKYAEIATALGFEGDAWFGDPLATHKEIVQRAKELNEKSHSRCRI